MSLARHIIYVFASNIIVVSIFLQVLDVAQTNKDPAVFKKISESTEMKLFLESIMQGLYVLW